MKVRVVTDSGGCMSKEQAKACQLDYLPLQIVVDDKTYLDGVDITNNVLYGLMENGAFPQTSQPPLYIIEDLMLQYEKEEVTDIILITLSSGLSGTNENVCAAAKRHGINVHTLDVYTTLAVEGYWATCAAQLAQQNVDPDEIIRRIQESVDHSSGYLMVENLDHLVKGGRLTPMAAKLAGMLKIVPILLVSKATQGKVGTFEKVRTMSKAIKRACEVILDSNVNENDYVYFVMDAKNEKGAKLAYKKLKAAYPNAEIQKSDLCAVIACHTGMQAVGLQFARKVEGC